MRRLTILILPSVSIPWRYLSTLNEGKSAASLCHQVAALVPDMFCNFYLAKNLKIDNNSATTKATEKISTYLESLEF